jgi:hypothetical protein
LPPPIRQIVRNNSSTSDYPRYTTEGRPSLECYRFQTLPLAPLSIKCFSVYLDSCILHVSYAPLSSWLRGTKASLPTSVPWGQNNDNLVCTFAGPMPVVLVPVAHQPPQNRQTDRIFDQAQGGLSDALACSNPGISTPESCCTAAYWPVPKSGALVRGHEGQGALGVWGLQPGGCTSQDRALTDFENTSCERVTITTAAHSAGSVQLPLFLATPTQLHFLEQPSHSTNVWLVHVPDIKCKGSAKSLSSPSSALLFKMWFAILPP